MNLFTLLKLLGHDWVQRQIASAIRKHVGPDGFKLLASSFSECLDGCNKMDSELVAQGITDVLFSIR